MLNKLAAWDLLDYERVVFLDADVVATSNPDVLEKDFDLFVLWFNYMFYLKWIFLFHEGRIASDLVFPISNTKQCCVVIRNRMRWACVT